MDFDLARALSRIKPEKWTGTLQPRPKDQLDFVDTAARFGVPLLLDTCAYIDSLEAQLPPSAEALLKSRPTRHVSTAIGELSHLFGRLQRSPLDRGMLAGLAAAIDGIELRHVSTPGAGTCLQAGILCGLVFRLGGFQKGQEVAALNDCTIYLHALENGHAVLTRNHNDFDRMNQIMPEGQVLFYNHV